MISPYFSCVFSFFFTVKISQKRRGTSPLIPTILKKKKPGQTTWFGLKLCQTAQFGMVPAGSALEPNPIAQPTWFKPNIIWYGLNWVIQHGSKNPAYKCIQVLLQFAQSMESSLQLFWKLCWLVQLSWMMLA